MPLVCKLSPCIFLSNRVYPESIQENKKLRNGKKMKVGRKNWVKIKVSLTKNNIKFGDLKNLVVQIFRKTKLRFQFLTTLLATGTSVRVDQRDTQITF